MIVLNDQRHGAVVNIHHSFSVSVSISTYVHNITTIDVISILFFQYFYVIIECFPLYKLGCIELPNLIYV
jgi:hypothetical protein